MPARVLSRRPAFATTPSDRRKRGHLAGTPGHPILWLMTITPDTSPATVWAILASWPRGYFTARFAGRRYGVTNTAHANGNSFKL